MGASYRFEEAADYAASAVPRKTSPPGRLTQRKPIRVRIRILVRQRVSNRFNRGQAGTLPEASSRN
jgi:hypothetical protein